MHENQNSTIKNQNSYFQLLVIQINICEQLYLYEIIFNRYFIFFPRKYINESVFQTKLSHITMWENRISVYAQLSKCVCNLGSIPNISTSIVCRCDEFLLADIQINRHLREQSDNDDRLLRATATKSFLSSEGNRCQRINTSTRALFERLARSRRISLPLGNGQE